MENAERKLPAVLEPAQNFFGHLLQYRKPQDVPVQEVFCTKFYTINGFLCLENVKTEQNLKSDEKPVKIVQLVKYFYYPSCKNYGNRFYFSHSWSEMVTKKYYTFMHMRTMPSSYLDDTCSFKEESEAPEWTKYNEEEARAIANQKTRELAEKARENNRKYLFEEVIPAYRRHIAHQKYFKSWWRRLEYLWKKTSGHFDKWVDDYICRHPCTDYSEVKKRIEGMEIEFDQEIDWNRINEIVPNEKAA